jgi:hypothetical protein
MSPCEEQKEATGLIHNNQIVIVTGREFWKSLVCAELH